MTIRWFSFMGSLAAGPREIRIAEGATADDLPDGDAGLHEIIDRVRQRYGALYGVTEAQWIELHAWENDPPHAALREWHLERDTDAPASQPEDH